MRRTALAALLLLLLGAAAITVSSRAGYAAQDREMPDASASSIHPAGTDALGRDRLTRTATAVLLGFGGAAAASALTTAIAAGVGTAAALGPAFLSGPLLLLCDAFLSLPWLFLLMMVRAGLPLNTAPLVSAAATFLILALFGWPVCARAVYARARAMRSAGWMVQARAGGLRPSQLILRHALPQTGSLLLPQFLVSIPAFLMAEANLGTLGLGVSEPLPSWGSMLLELDSASMLVGSAWVYLPILLLVFSLVLLELLMVEP